MPRHVAFLRAVNVGGRVVRMETLVRAFERLGFSEVETFLASGNVVFGAAARPGPRLEARIEAALGEALGYEVATFLRSPAELAAVARAAPFADEPGVLNVAFLRGAPDAAAKRRVLALRGPEDELAILGRELWWGRRSRQSESRLSNAAFEKALGAPATLRGISTVRRLAARLEVRDRPPVQFER